jgi:hypothetical protein
MYAQGESTDTSKPAVNYSDSLNPKTFLIQVTIMNSTSGAARAAKGMKFVSDEI